MVRPDERSLHITIDPNLAKLIAQKASRLQRHCDLLFAYNGLILHFSLSRRLYIRTGQSCHRLKHNKVLTSTTTQISSVCLSANPVDDAARIQLQKMLVDAYREVQQDLDECSSNAADPASPSRPSVYPPLNSVQRKLHRRFTIAGAIAPRVQESDNSETALQGEQDNLRDGCITTPTTPTTAGSKRWRKALRLTKTLCATDDSEPPPTTPRDAAQTRSPLRSPGQYIKNWSPMRTWKSSNASSLDTHAGRSRSGSLSKLISALSSPSRKSTSKTKGSGLCVSKSPVDNSRKAPISASTSPAPPKQDGLAPTTLPFQNRRRAVSSPSVCTGSTSSLGSPRATLVDPKTPTRAIHRDSLNTPEEIDEIDAFFNGPSAPRHDRSAFQPRTSLGKKLFRQDDNSADYFSHHHKFAPSPFLEFEQNLKSAADHQSPSVPRKKYTPLEDPALMPWPQRRPSRSIVSPVLARRPPTTQVAQRSHSFSELAVFMTIQLVLLLYYLLLAFPVACVVAEAVFPWGSIHMPSALISTTTLFSILFAKFDNWLAS
ncbi:hypothetical protein HGRIS_007142 [Hohenbuehelia grisea]|uniref:Uncharacterized protein n=1 Tax=Hohenbuehelia grisea TaxID=104357 RepID=A0ABR3JBA2_9AGAR